MRCLNCGCDVSNDEPFCSECDSNTDCGHRKDSFSLNWRAIRTSSAGFTFGLSALVLVVLKYGILGIVLSLIGLFFSSYSMGVTTFINMRKRQKIIIFVTAAIGLIVSAISFIFGLQCQFA